MKVILALRSDLEVDAFSNLMTKLLFIVRELL